MCQFFKLFLFQYSNYYLLSISNLSTETLILFFFFFMTKIQSLNMFFVQVIIDERDSKTF